MCIFVLYRINSVLCEVCMAICSLLTASHMYVWGLYHRLVIVEYADLLCM